MALFFGGAFVCQQAICRSRRNPYGNRVSQLATLTTELFALRREFCVSKADEGVARRSLLVKGGLDDDKIRLRGSTRSGNEKTDGQTELLSLLGHRLENDLVGVLLPALVRLLLCRG